MDDEAFVKDYKEGDKAFSRDRIFTFKVLLCFLMSNLQKAIQREIALFKDAIEFDGGSIPEVSKAAFCKARNKLKPTVFVALSDIVLDEFYQSELVQRWRGTSCQRQSAGYYSGHYQNQIKMQAYPYRTGRRRN
jgi:hypothetical protein